MDNKREHNTRLAIGRLPNEVLINIFSFVLFVDKRYLFLRDQKDSVGSGLLPSHVCSRWREISLANSHLWADIQPHCFQLTREILTRAKTVPLSVNMNRATSNRCALELLKHLDHTRSLRISIIRGGWLGTDIIPELSRAAPILEVFRLELMAYYSEGLHIPESLFSGGAPQLRSLTVLGAGIFWSKEISRFSNLQELDLYHMDFVDGNNAPTPSEKMLGIISTLSLLRNLRKLKLHTFLVNYGQSGSAHIYDDLPTCDLPFLTEVEIHDSFTAVDVLLEALSTTTWTAIYLQCRPYGSPEEADPRLERFAYNLSTPFRLGRIPPPRAISLDFPRRGDCDIFAGPRLVPSPDLRDLSARVVESSISLRMGAAENDPLRVLTAGLLANIPVTDVTDLEIIGDPVVESEFIAANLAVAPVQNLRIRQSASLLHALTYLVPKGPSRPLIWSGLRSLTLQDVDFRKAMFDPGPELCCALCMRAADGRPTLEVLEIRKGFNLTEDLLRQMSDTVAKLWVDGEDWDDVENDLDD
jgi:hypothetical protein